MGHKSRIVSAALGMILVVACGTTQQRASQSSSENEVSEVKESDMKPNPTSKKRILFVLTSHDTKGETGDPTGFYLSEAAHPWSVLKDRYEIAFASPKGGEPPVDGKDLSDPINRAFWEDPDIHEAITHTLRPDQIAPSQYAAVHFVGGHGTMWDFPDNHHLAGIAAEIYENGGVVSAVCHGPAGLVNIRLKSGAYLVDGKKVTGFSNDEEEAVGLTDVVPFLLEDRLKERGGLYTSAEKFTDHVVVDGRLITGQNPASAKTLGEALAKAIEE